jgi:predicted RND superfamily exporter protein
MKDLQLRDRFHGALATLTTRHPRWTIIGALLVSVVAFRLAVKPLENIDTDILRQLPHDMPEVEAYRRAVRDFGAFDYLYGVVETANGESNPALLIDAAGALARALDNPEFIFEVQWSLDPDTEEHLRGPSDTPRSLLLPAEQWPAVRNALLNPRALHRQVLRMRHLLTSPLPPRLVRRQIGNPWNIENRLRRRLLALRGPVAFDPRSGHMISGDGQMLLLVIRPLKPATDLLFAQELMQHADKAADEITKAFGNRVRIGFLGPHTETLYDTTLLQRDVLSTAIASGICVIALFIIAFRRWSAILFVGVPLGLGILWTLGLVGLMIGHLTIITCAFAAILLGLGNDFGVHLYNRFLEDRLEGHPTSQSVSTALMQVGPGIFTGAVTTAAAFFALLLSDFPGFRELGLIGGTGVLCCMASMYVVMPSLLMVLHHHRPRSRYQHLTSFGLEAVADAVARRPRATLLAGLIVTAWLGFLSLNLRFDDSLFHLRDLPAEHQALLTRVQNRFHLPGQPLLLTASVGPDLQRALEVNDTIAGDLTRMAGEYDIAAIDSLRTILPSAGSQQRSRQQVGSLDIPSVGRDLISAAEGVDLSPRAVKPAVKWLKDWKAETQRAQPLRLTLSSRRSLRRLVTNYVTHDSDEFRVLTSVYPERSRMSAEEQSALVGRLRRDLKAQIDPPDAEAVRLEATGVTALVEELRDLVKRDLVLMVFVATLAVLAILWMHFRSMRHALLVTVPVLSGLLWTLGLMAAVGAPLNFINVLALPIIIGLSIDNGLHILERHRREEHGNIGEALVKTGRAVVVTSLSTILGFGALSLASFRGIQQMGILALVGTALSLIAVTTLIPATIDAAGGRRGWRGLIRPDEG